MTGTVETGGLRINDLLWPVSVDGAKTGDLVTVSVRPEHLAIEPGGQLGSIAGTVISATFLGATRRLTIRCDDGLHILVEEPSTATAGNRARDGRVHVRPDYAHVVALDREAAW
ncbi:TOBE domain-containing protein (plasmid) [Devosia sp. A8/3-2]|nr:TOBE domain-containing protein [Devosia sp. A8/3-2]